VLIREVNFLRALSEWTCVHENLRRAGQSPTPVIKRRTSPLTYTGEKESGNCWSRELFFLIFEEGREKRVKKKFSAPPAIWRSVFACLDVEEEL
ncbi:MAG: hypothetical protein ACREA2_04515, partial [Blastocatellia bacterium]